MRIDRRAAGPDGHRLRHMEMRARDGQSPRAAARNAQHAVRQGVPCCGRRQGRLGTVPAKDHVDDDGELIDMKKKDQPKASAEQRFISTAEAARRLGTDERVIRHWLTTGRLKGKGVRTGHIKTVYRVDAATLKDVYKAVCRRCGRRFRTGPRPGRAAFCSVTCRRAWFHELEKEQRKQKRDKLSDRK